VRVFGCGAHDSRLVCYFVGMAAKKKSSSAKPAKKKSGAEDDPKLKKHAINEATKAAIKYQSSPMNRAQVIQPPGKSYTPGQPGFYFKTRGRAQAMTKVYMNRYNEVIKELDSAIAKKKKKGKS